MRETVKAYLDAAGRLSAKLHEGLEALPRRAEREICLMLELEHFTGWRGTILPFSVLFPWSVKERAPLSAMARIEESGGLS